MTSALLRLCAAFTFLLAALAPSTSWSQTWPDKPVRIIVPFAAGGSLDFVTRLVAQGLAEDLGQPVVVENRTGANGNIGAEYAARQPADGYTLLATADALLSSAHLYKLGFDPMKDLLPVVQFTRQPVVLAAHPSLGVSTLAELVALAKRQPGLSYATSGAGSGQHILGEWLSHSAGIRLTHVPYKGGALAIGDLVAGHVPLGSLGSAPVMAHYKRGALRVLAQSTATRSASLPDVPTYQEGGMKGMVLDQWLGLFAPTGTPDAIVQRLNRSVVRILDAAAVRERLQPQALDVAAGTQAAFARLYREDHEKYGRLIRELGIKIN